MHYHTTAPWLMERLISFSNDGRGWTEGVGMRTANIFHRSWVTRPRSGYVDFNKPSRTLMFKAEVKINPRVHHGNDGPNGLIFLYEVSFLIFRRTNTRLWRISLQGWAEGSCAHDLTLGTPGTFAKFGGYWPSHSF